MPETLVLKPDHLDGVAYLHAMMNGELPMPPMCETLPIRVQKAEQGYVEMVAKAGIEHTNTLGGVHGGFAATVIDSVTGCTVLSMLEAGVNYTTISLELKMLRPPPMNEEMVAEGRIVNISRRLAVANGVLKTRQGKLVAEGSSTCMVFR